MVTLKCKEILEATGGILVSGNIDTEFKGISTDSRKMAPGNLFIPLIGQRFDGHDFIRDAVRADAAGVLSQRDAVDAGDAVVIKVSDTLKALRDIAKYHREKFKIPVVAVTGSVGKTSTKDMIANVLGKKYKVLKSEGNLNNEIGLPLSIFQLDDTYEAAVVEMGMNSFGEISRLTAISQPDIAVITNIGLAHVEKLGSRQNILKAKMEILESMDENDLLVLNGDDNLLYGLKDLIGFRKVYYGMEEGIDYQAYNIKTAGEQGIYFEMAVSNKNWNIHVPLPGIHNIYSALAAVAVGIELGVPMERIVEGISESRPSDMRLNIITKDEIKIINDAYNANPQSMEAAIEVLREVSKGKRTIAVLGDMLELGGIAEKAHNAVGRFAFSKGIDYIITVGDLSRNIAKGAINAGAQPDKVYSLENNKQASAFIKEFAKKGDVILIKGSRGMKMEEIVYELTK